MAFCVLTYKAWKINRKVRRLEREKENSIRLQEGKPPVYTLRDKWHHFWLRCRQRLVPLCTLGPDSAIEHFWIKLRMDGTYENFVAKSIIGFLGGVLLTYGFFIFFIIQLHFSMVTSAIWCIFLGTILTLGLAFSPRVRVVVFLILPIFFSKRGRQALVAYAFVLTLSGPVRNALRNTEILSESLACGQEQLKAMTQQIMEAIKKPILALKEALKKVMKIMKTAVKKVKEMVLVLKRIIMTVVTVIKTALQWLGSIINICNKKVGTPFQRCMRAFEGAVVDCQAKMGVFFSWLCSIAYVVSIVCYIVKIFDFICTFIDFLNNNVIDVVKKKMRAFMRRVEDIFYVSVEFQHSFKFETNQSVSIQDIGKDIAKEIKQKTSTMMALFDWMAFAFTFFFLLIFFKALRYHRKFLTKDRFDNHYITEDFIDIDLRRAMLEQESILPLTKKERRLYIRAKSIRLVKMERVKIAKSAIFLGITTLKMCVCIFADYSLYWIMAQIKQYGSIKTYLDSPTPVEAHVVGKGLLADLFRVIIKAFKPLGVKLNVDTTECLPNPVPPDTDRYFQIISILLMCWIFTILEPYGLRLRHSIMCYYYPDRAKERATWLYNHILRSRGTFLKFALRQLRRKYGKSKDGVTEKVTLMDRIRAVCPWVRYILGESTQQRCLLCASVKHEGDKEQFIHCPTPQCIGIYCSSCFAELNNICSICKSPLEYGDLSDISEERDSSDDPIPHPELQHKKGPHEAKFLKRGNPNDIEKGDSTSSEASLDGNYKLPATKLSQHFKNEMPQFLPEHERKKNKEEKQARPQEKDKTLKSEAKPKRIYTRKYPGVQSKDKNELEPLLNKENETSDKEDDHS